MQIIWTEQARQQVKSAMDYCKATFGTRILIRFSGQLKADIVRLGKNPFMGLVEPLLEGRNKVYRSLVIHKLYKLVYYVDEETIYIADLWDVRRDPDRLIARLPL
ncbi:type II toxin-antitoxin system RelE/ParE family toxin [Parabacteroides acidifaciens]|uniref:Type II toxin-antitoxin system RelE/ParE family toxin n=1 Tax=Parabacteroides acidifaciens TaxID=2290935 RepID=A0A3D8HIQ2_9BACT|nr:type II toxin-antitoxin system RelE/ParE family toxin [Parabacteroides acidifaciens]MBC8600500.1 type II toxin-antitoxin system RelE/ParE family toxin [Parabacteroides acidifaciens]RDU50801.1 type II toxin-antitoxin system RelE/ParE family toxin [Parabacteroides acidifaciens]